MIKDHLERYLEGEVPPIPEEYRELHRSALAEMIKLSARAVHPAENQVETIYQMAIGEAKERFEAARTRVERDYQVRKNAIEQDYQIQQDDIKVRFDTDFQMLEDQIQKRRNDIVSKRDSIEQDARQRCEY